MRLTLRTLLAYLDDTLPADRAREIGLKVAENPSTQELIDRIKRMTRKRGLSTPPSGPAGTAADANMVAEYLDDALTPELLAKFEETCLEQDVHLAEVAACHQILTLVLCEQVPVPPLARRRMYELVHGPESLPNRKPGKTIPIGGIRDEHKPTFDESDDAAFLMGLSAYSRTDPPRQILYRSTLLLTLIGLMALAVYFAWPSGQRIPRDVAVMRSTAPTTPVTAAAVENKAPPLVEPEKPAIGPIPEVTDVKPVPPEKPAENPTTPPTAVETTGNKVTIPAPKLDRVVVGRLEKREPAAIVVRKSPTNPLFQRVMLEEPLLITTDPLVCLPGYKALLKFDQDPKFEGQVMVEMWGNLPEFFPAPLLAASMTPTLPADGFAADFTLESGRFYFSSKRPTGAKIRLRMRAETWDIVLPDDKTEIAVELIHEPVLGKQIKAPQTVAGLFVMFGSPAITSSSGKSVRASKGDEVFWDSVSNTTRLRVHADAKVRESRVAYWSKFPVYADTTKATATLSTLNQFAKSLADPLRVRVTFDEAIQSKADAPMQQTSTSARVAVYMFGALRELNALADCLSDPVRPVMRETAIDALRFAFAGDATLPEQFRMILIDKLRLPEDQADATMRWLRALSTDERLDVDTLDVLLKALNAEEITVRETAFNVLASYVDPKDEANRSLLSFDAGDKPEKRTAYVTAWTRKVEELKKKILETPTP